MKKQKLFIGTSGYSYKHWQERFYPAGISSKRWLEFYSSQFSTVELNVTFYRVPQPRSFLSWYERTPSNFIFSVKGSRYISHIKRLQGVEDSLKLFFERAFLLKEKLHCILWQFPAKFKIDIKRLESFLQLLSNYNVRNVFEFRHSSWFSEQTFSLIKEHNYALCCADYPGFEGSIPVPLSDFIYIRRHGPVNMYQSKYSDKQINEDAKISREFIRDGCDVYIYFNNDFCAYAIDNALMLKRLLKDY